MIGLFVCLLFFDINTGYRPARECPALHTFIYKKHRFFLVKVLSISCLHKLIRSLGIFNTTVSLSNKIQLLRSEITLRINSNNLHKIQYFYVCIYTYIYIYIYIYTYIIENQLKLKSHFI